MNEYKVVMTGPVGAGKTTAVQSLGCSSLVYTDVNATDIAVKRKPTSTVAMDYGVYNSGKERIHLYGTPGQERFDFMWDILSIGAMGLILLIDNSRENPLQDMKQFLKLFPAFINKGQVVVGVTCTDVATTPAINHYQDELTKLGYEFPVCSTDARNGESVLNTIYTLLEMQERRAA